MVISALSAVVLATCVAGRCCAVRERGGEGAGVEGAAHFQRVDAQQQRYDHALQGAEGGRGGVQQQRGRQRLYLGAFVGTGVVAGASLRVDASGLRPEAGSARGRSSEVRHYRGLRKTTRHKGEDPMAGLRRTHHSAKPPSSCRQIGLRHACPVSSPCRTAASSISTPSPGPGGGRACPAVNWKIVGSST